MHWVLKDLSACFHPLKASQTNTDLSRAKFERDRRQCAEQGGELNRGGCCEGGEDAEDDADDDDSDGDDDDNDVMMGMLRTRFDW